VAADHDDVPVVDGMVGKRERFGGGHEVPDPEGVGQGPAARDVVVVDMGLGHGGDTHPGRGGRSQDPLHVTLRVDHDRHLAVVDDRCVVPELGRFDGQGTNHGSLRWAAVRCTLPEAGEEML
jgi:hypothetical protein